MEKSKNDVVVNGGGSKPDEPSQDNRDQPEVLLLHLPSDGGYGIVVAFMTFTINFFVGGILMNFGKLLTEISDELSVPRVQIALIGSTFMGFHFCSGPFAGALINCIGFRKSGVLGTLIASFSMFMASTSTSFVQLAIFYGICGVGTGIMVVMGDICVGYHFDKYRPLAAGFTSSGTGFGTFAMTPFINMIINHSSGEKGHWQHFMRSEAAVLLCLTLVVMLAAKPNIMRIDAEKPGRPRQTWLQRVFSPTMEDESESEAEEPTGSFRRFSLRSSGWSTMSLKSFRSEKFVHFQDTPTLAEIFEIQSPEPELEPEVPVPPPPKEKFSLQTFFTKPRYSLRPFKRTLTPQLFDSDDILYSKSTTAIANHRATVLNLPPASSILKKKLLLTRAPPPVYHVSRWKKFCFHVRRSLLMIFDVSMFKSPSFDVLCMACLCYAFGLFVPFMYITDRAIDNGIPRDQAMWLVSIIGLANIFLRFIIGLISLHPAIVAAKFTALSLMFSGSSSIVTAFFPQHPFLYQAIYCACFALGNAAFMALRSVVYVETMSIQKLTKTFGLCSLMLGVGITVGTPTLGVFKNVTGDYKYTFISSGVFFIASGVFHFILPHVKKWEEGKEAE